MKRLLSSLAVTFLLIVATQAYSQGISNRIPEKVIKILDTDYSGWKFAEVSGDIYEFFRVSNVQFDPNFIRGDFDGDGKSDCAVQIAHKGERVVIAFLQRGEIYEIFVLDSHGQEMIDVYLWLHEKGQKDDDYELEEEFIYVNDSIGVNYFERGGVTYIFNNGKFQSKITSD